MNKPIVSVTEKDCRWEYFRGSGAGGQKRNKTSSACRCTHIESGAVGTAQDGRSQRQNKETAFQRMAETAPFQTWIRRKTQEALGIDKIIQAKVDRMMEGPIRAEVLKDGRWVEEKEVAT